MQAHRVLEHEGRRGKSTLAANLGASLAQLPKTKKVVLIDADTQCNLTAHYVRDQDVDDEGSRDNDSPPSDKKQKRGNDSITRGDPLADTDIFSNDLYVSGNGTAE